MSELADYLQKQFERGRITKTVSHLILGKYKALEFENKELREINSQTYCAYCRERFSRDENDFKTLQNHIAVCKLHPMRKLEADNERLTKALEKLRVKEHYECEDSWYSCPKHSDYIGEDDRNRCNCGMDKTNAIIDAALAESEQNHADNKNRQ